MRKNGREVKEERGRTLPERNIKKKKKKESEGKRGRRGETELKG